MNKASLNPPAESAVATASPEFSIQRESALAIKAPETAEPAPAIRAWYWPRLRASGLHFLMSLLVVASVAFLIVKFWYPGALIFASGGVKLLLLIAVVDLVLGPLLTFVVFDRKKKSLVFDLTFIVVIQLAAIAYGAHASYLGRPVFQVFTVDRFELVSAAEVDAAELTLADPKFQSFTTGGPMLVAAQTPTDSKARMELVLATNHGVDLKHFIRYYVDYSSVKSQVLSVAKPLSDLERLNDPVPIKQQLNALLAQRSPEQMRFVPIQGKREDLTMILDARDATPLAIVRLRPWSD